MAIETDYSVLRARRISPSDHPNDHIDVTVQHDDTGRQRTLRFDVAENVARFRREVAGEADPSWDVDESLVRQAALYVDRETSVDDALVNVDAPDLADGVVRSESVSEVVEE